jgi:hypothetical protein
MKRKLLQQNPKVVERFVRIFILRRTKFIIQSFARRISRPRMQWNERKRRVVLDSTIKTLAKQAAQAKQLNLTASSSVLNLGLFFLIAERDIQSVKIDALTHPDPWQRSLCARVMLLTIHELEIDKAAGNQLREAMNSTNVPEQLREIVTLSLRVIRKAQEKAQKQFYLLRNTTIAHRDIDALRQHTAITTLDPIVVVGIAAEFYSGSHAFLSVLPTLLTHVSNLSGLLKQLALTSTTTAHLT